VSTFDEARAWFLANGNDVEGWVTDRPWIVRRAAELASESENNAGSYLRAAFEAENGKRPAPQPMPAPTSGLSVEDAREALRKDPSQANAVRYAKSRLRQVIPDSFYQQG
jgi:hypothetical protein